jgi:protein gp37
MGHNTQNFWVGCDKVAPECAHCYIDRLLIKQGREPWGKVYRTKTWAMPPRWERKATVANHALRVFTCSLSDFFHVKADPWRDEAWEIIKNTPHLVWLILTKRPALIEKRLPADWGNGYPNVWLGTSTGCVQTLNKMDALREIPCALRWVSTEPLLEDISQKINLVGYGWVVTGGESGFGQEYRWDSNADWRSEFERGGRRTMLLKWSENLRDVTKAAGLPFMFKQVTNPRSGQGVNAIGDWHEVPDAPGGMEWKPRTAIAEKNLWTPIQIQALRVSQQ